MINYTLNIQDNGFLFIRADVEDSPYFEDIKIKGLKVDTSLTYGTGHPYETLTQDATTTFVTGVILPPTHQQFFIITPIIEGDPRPDTPCNKDVPDIGIIYNKEYLLSKGMNYLKELGDSCNIPKGFIDFILKQKALDMAIATCNPSVAHKYWNMLTVANGGTLKGCGCNGKK